MSGEILNPGVPEEKNLTVNVMFTPDTFKYQSLFLLSLLKHLDCKFRIVANGCEEHEIQSMKEFCRKREAVETLVLPFPKLQSHGLALSWLQEQETSDYFCFMDSDIVATGNFLADILPLLERYSAVFSGRPIWQEEGEDILPEDHRRVMGRYQWNSSGLFLGSTYFAVYKNHHVSHIRKTFNVDFDLKKWPALPPPVKLMMVKMGQPAQHYDTAKVMNILLQEAGHELVQREPPHLHHIGGLSCGVLRGPLGHINPAFPPSPKTVFKKKLNVYFNDLLEALFENRNPPTPPETDIVSVAQVVAATRRHVIDAFNQFRGELP